MPIHVRGDKHAPERTHNSIWPTSRPWLQTTMTSENDRRIITAQTSLRWSNHAQTSQKEPEKRELK